MNLRARFTFTTAICCAGILTPGVLYAPQQTAGRTPLSVSHERIDVEPPRLSGDPPVLQVVHAPSHDERLALEPLYDDVVAIQREQYGHCGEFHDEAMAVGWLPSQWKRLRGIIARETGNTCDPGVLNNTDATRDFSFGLLQINMRGDLGADRVARCGLTSYEDLWDPKTNLACGLVLYEIAGWQPWWTANWKPEK